MYILHVSNISLGERETERLILGLIYVVLINLFFTETVMCQQQ